MGRDAQCALGVQNGGWFQAWSQLGPEGGPAQRATLAVCWQASLVITAWRSESGCLGSSPGSSTCYLCDLQHVN